MDRLVEALEQDTDRPFGAFGLRCKTCRLLHELPGEDPRAEIVRTAIEGTVPASTVSQRLRFAGVHIGADSISKHRRGVCKTREAVQRG